MQQHTCHHHSGSGEMSMKGLLSACAILALITNEECEKIRRAEVSRPRRPPFAAFPARGLRPLSSGYVNHVDTGRHIEQFARNWHGAPLRHRRHAAECLVNSVDDLEARFLHEGGALGRVNPTGGQSVDFPPDWESRPLLPPRTRYGRRIGAALTSPISCTGASDRRALLFTLQRRVPYQR